MQNVITLVTSITHFPDATVTKYYNTSTLVNTSYVTSWYTGVSQIPALNLATGRQMVTQVELNVINVPAVTDSKGNPACTTTSTGSVVCTGLTNSTTILSDMIFPGVNTYAEAYFINESTNAPTVTFAPSRNSINDYTIISFSTSFIYQPLRRALTSVLTLASKDDALEDFGHVPQTLIDWMAQNSDYAAQYPGLNSCLPRGPSILPPDACELHPADLVTAPVVAAPMPGIVLNQAFTVQGEGCFHPGACPTSEPASNVQATPAAAVAGNAAQLTAAPSSKSVAGIPLASQFLHPSSKGTADFSTQISDSHQEPPKEQSSSQASPNRNSSPPDSLPDTSPSSQNNSPAKALPKNQTAQPSSSTSSNQPVPIIPSAIGQSVTSIPQPQPQPQLQPNTESTNQPPSTFILSSTNTNFILDTSNTITPNGPELVQPNIASTIMAGSGPTPVPSPPAPLVVGRQILTPGAAPVTISGTVYSLPTSNPTVIYINNSPSPLPSLSTAVAASGTAQPNLVLGSQTLVPGAAITVSGAGVSLPVAGAGGRGSEVVVDGSTETFAPTAVSGGAGEVEVTVGTGAVSASFLAASPSGGSGDGGNASSSGMVGGGGYGNGSSYTGPGFTSGASSWRRRREGWEWGGILGAMIGVEILGGGMMLM
ncbi:MAG: hypothetical protein Q9225_003179 [Loekoesia sp. 1 TL-2023]